MAIFQPVRDRHGFAQFAPRSITACLQKPVGGSSKSGNNHKWSAGKPLSDDIAGAIDGGGILHRRAAKLNHNHFARITQRFGQEAGP